MVPDDNPEQPFQRFSPYPKHKLTPEEQKEWDWYEQEKKRPKITCHDWMFEQWLRERDNSA